MALSDTT